MERYYNFGGEGILAAEPAGLPSLLEVNSPVVDHPGLAEGACSTPCCCVRPLRRYREGLCREAAALVAPIPEIVPACSREPRREIGDLGRERERLHVRAPGRGDATPRWGFPRRPWW